MGRDLRWIAVGLTALGVVAPAARGADHPVSFPTDPFPGLYSPSSVEAGGGDTVTFSGAFASHPLVWTDSDFATRSTGTTDTYTFTRPGTFRVHCQIHPTMTGQVHVPGNQTATPSFTWHASGTTVSFTAAGADPDGTIARFEWDLDGNGTFEATGAAPTKVYSPGSSTTVRLRSVDDAHETSPATSQVVTVAGTPPAPGGGGGGGGGTGTGSPPPGGGGASGGGSGAAAGSPSSTRPGDGGGTAPSSGGGDQGGGGADRPRVRVVSSALVFRHGRATATLRLPEDGTVRVRIVRGGTTLASGSAARLKTGTRRVTVKLTRAGTRALKGGKRVRATVTVTLKPRAGGRSLTAHRTATVGGG
jgi:plastocyanin